MKTLINKRWEIDLPEHRHNALDWDSWEKERLDALHKNIREGDTLMDIGAEQGDLTCLFAMWGADVIPIEPNPLFWPTIKQIFAMNDQEIIGSFAGFASTKDVMPTDLLEEPFRLVPAYTQDGVEYGQQKSRWPGCAYGDAIQNNDFRNVLERSHDTPQTRIDSFTIKPDIINMDIEGAEWEALKGATETLKKYKPLVFVSIHPEFMVNDYGYTKEDLLFWMAELGYEMELLAIDHEWHFMLWHKDGRQVIR